MLDGKVEWDRHEAQKTQQEELTGVSTTLGRFYEKVLAVLDDCPWRSLMLTLAEKLPPAIVGHSA
jgi:hypothetical protein